jgi:hypothetical protein
MHRQRIPKLALAMGAAAILIPSLPSKTQAASGTFYYVRADNGRDAALSRTPDGQCLRLPGGASYVQNDTNADANLYTSSNCTGVGRGVGSRQAKEFSSPYPTFVEFG